MVGLYKITSPTNKIYIGQSWDISKRIYGYKNRTPSKNNIGLHRSFTKHGVGSHSFDILAELPIDVSQVVLDEYEKFYISQHKEAGFKMLNMQLGGRGGKHSEESKVKMAKSHTGKKLTEEHRKNIGKANVGKHSGPKHSDEARAKIKAKRALQKNVRGREQGAAPWNKGMIGQYKTRGHPITDEVKEKIRKALTGKKLSPESIAKRTATRKARGIGFGGNRL